MGKAAPLNLLFDVVKKGVGTNDDLQVLDPPIAPLVSAVFFAVADGLAVGGDASIIPGVSFGVVEAELEIAVGCADLYFITVGMEIFIRHLFTVELRRQVMPGRELSPVGAHRVRLRQLR